MKLISINPSGYPLCLLLFFLPLFFNHSLLAQSVGKITGKVLDSATRQPIEYATITLTDQKLQKVINGAITDASGGFGILAVPAGTYKATIDFIGYRKAIVDNIVFNGKTLSLNVIPLAQAGQTLKGVTVTGTMPIIENKIDKLVYNAANDITAQGGVATDVLKKVPMVTVDIDGNVELQGNTNIQFLINGKPSSVFGSSVTDALAAIPASQIKSIEVITSPGAKYDAQGTGGIINIILKDNKVRGVNANIALAGGTRLENGSANVNMRHGDWGVNAFLSGNAQLLSHTPSVQDRTSVDASGASRHLVQDGYSDYKRHGLQAGMGADWSITKKDNLTASFSFYNSENNNSGLTNISGDSAGYSSLPMVRNTTSSSVNKSFDWNVNYKKNFKKEGQELSVAYYGSSGSPHSDYEQTLTTAGSPLPATGSKSSNPGTDNFQTLALDYAQPFAKSSTFETGIKSVFQSLASQADVNNYRPQYDDFITDPTQSYHLTFNRQIYAGYASLSFPLSKNFKMKTGVRYEHTDTKIDFANTAVPAYNSLVPSIVISHDIKNGFLKLSYSRRLERPDYWDINPFLNRADPYNFTTGNPSLTPEIGNNFELGFNKSLGKSHGNIYVSLYERINTHDHKQITIFYSQYKYGDSTYTNVSVSDVQNTGTEYNTGINISGSYSINEKLTFRGNISATSRYLVTSIGSGDVNAGIRVRTNLTVTYLLPHNVITEAFGNYNSASGNIQGRSPQYISYTLAMRKQFWNKNASIGVTATNLFNKYTQQITTVSTTNYTSDYTRWVPNRSVGISLTCRVGKLEFKKGRDDENFLNSPSNMGN